MKPVVNAYFITYNEEYILPHLLKYYSTFCEKITFIDNESTDNSHNIINSFPNTNILKYDTNNEIRDDIYLTIKNNVWKESKGKSNYVIVGDADEFLYHKNMVEFLSDIFIKGYTIVTPVGYQMIGDEDLNLTPSDNILEKVTKGIRAECVDKLMLFDCNQIDEINYSFGCHVASPTGNVRVLNSPDLKMLHYKYLGLDNFLMKQVRSGKRLSEFNKQRGLGMYYLYDESKHQAEYKTFIEKRVEALC
jgi:hypothetical protein